MSILKILNSITGVRWREIGSNGNARYFRCKEREIEVLEDQGFLTITEDGETLWSGYSEDFSK